MLMLSIPLLIILALCTLLIIDSFTGIISESKESTLSGVSKYFICLGIVGLLLALLVNFSVSDYRAWSATRSVKLTIYQEGFTYESQGRTDICRWDEIEKIRYKSDQVTSKALRFRMVKVIRSIVKKDDAVIKLAETLDLREIADLIIAAKKVD
jgi:hypothetical protein